jgi:HEAT repeat protein
VRAHPLIGAAAACLAAGCAEIPKGFDSPEPAARMEAAAEAAGRGDPGAIPRLIELLDSDDPATRLVAILSLERLTGRRLGYDPAAGLEAREEAVERWVVWYNANADRLEREASGPRSEPSG